MLLGHTPGSGSGSTQAASLLLAFCTLSFELIVAEIAYWPENHLQSPPPIFIQTNPRDLNFRREIFQSVSVEG